MQIQVLPAQHVSGLHLHICQYLSQSNSYAFSFFDGRSTILEEPFFLLNLSSSDPFLSFLLYISFQALLERLDFLGHKFHRGVGEKTS